jgi:GNAT superfamily N-acetyltransferase
MALTYFKRYRMEINLLSRDYRRLAVPVGYRLLPWESPLLEAHAEVKYESFHDTIDASVFPCFTELAGCYRLMSEIVRKPGFVPQATWLAAYADADFGPGQYCGTVQGLRDESGLGAIQNLGVVPEHRGRGLGIVLMDRALRGFRQIGLTRAFLEVTADNRDAIRLYERMGFSVVKTVYKATEAAC